MDVIYAGRPIQRFWFLETVARMPYFSYISMLHLYESLGWWRAGAELRRVCVRLPRRHISLLFTCSMSLNTGGECRAAPLWSTLREWANALHPFSASLPFAAE